MTMVQSSLSRASITEFFRLMEVGQKRDKQPHTMQGKYKQEVWRHYF
jgi:hypothetical protein